MPEYHDYYQIDPLGISKYINTLKVPDSWLKELFEIFEIYNFTIDENTSVDIELSIEPEMLGRIFENLLAEINPETGNTARKSTGSYYTPRPIVEYMVDESLKQYLFIKTNLDENKISSLLAYEEEKTGLSEPEKDAVIDALDVIKIIDPACGSGAFPMGILQKMLLILQKIDPESKKWLSKKVSRIESSIVRKELQKKIEAGNWNYIHKLGIIQNSIYGVDIQSIAVDISKLRFFLSLIVDEKVDDAKENRGVDWLPNLEFKFVCANSLIGLPSTLVGSYKKGLQPKLFEAIDNITELKKLREEYLRCYGDEKISIEKKFQDIQNKMFMRSLKWLNWGGGDSQTVKLSQWNPFSGESCAWFDPDWMFGVRKGFDVVIANPPYVGEKGHKEIFREIKQGKLGKFYQGKMDLFYFFFHIALNLGKQNSNIAFITTNYYITAKGAKKLRQDFKERAIIKKLINFNKLKIFKSATGQHNMVTILAKGQDSEAIAKTCITKRTGDATSEILNSVVSWHDDKTDYFEMAQKDLYDGDECYLRFVGNSTTLVNPIQIILGKVKNQSKDLISLCNVNCGIQTGCDEIKIGGTKQGVFILSDEEIKAFNNEERKLIKPFFNTSDIYKYFVNLKNYSWVIYADRNTDTISKYINLHKHFNKKEYRKVLDNIREVKNGRIKYFQLQWPRNEEIFKGEKIVCSQRSNLNVFGYSNGEWYGGSGIFFITKKDKSIFVKYILALINSKLYYIWLYYRGKRKGETLELIAKPLSEIPIKKISESEQNPFIEIVNKILSITKSSDYLENPEKQAQVKEYKKQINQLVYKLYGLTDDEIKIVENFHKKA